MYNKSRSNLGLLGLASAVAAGLGTRATQMATDFEGVNFRVHVPKHTSRSKYSPHQGKKECMRRLKQQDKKVLKFWGSFSPAPITRETFEEQYLLHPSPEPMTVTTGAAPAVTSLAERIAAAKLKLAEG